MIPTNQKDGNSYAKIIEDIFERRYRDGDNSVAFRREDITEAAARLGVKAPRNLGDLLYSFRYRAALPVSIISTAAAGWEWAIFPAGRSVYEFRQVRFSTIEPNRRLARVKIPDSTPGAISMYALSDEQALLAMLRYNNLINIFTQLTCYSLQNHLRTSIPIWNPIQETHQSTQVETDELYIGIDKQGVHYAMPVEAKGINDTLNIIQIWQNYNVCQTKFPNLPVRCIAAQTIHESGIALFEIRADEPENIVVVEEKHYELVPPEEITEADFQQYRSSLKE